MLLYYTLVSIINVITMLILVQMIRQNYRLSRKTRLFLRIATWLIILVTITETFTLYLNYADKAYRPLHLLCIIIGFTITPFIPIMMGYGIGDSTQKNLRIFLIPIFLNFILIPLSAKFGFIFWVSPENVYQRNEYYWIFIIAYLCGMTFFFFQSLISIKIYQIKNASTLFLMFLFLSLGTSIQVIFPNLPLSWLCVSSSMALYYAYYSDLIQQMDVLTGLLNRSAYEARISEINGRKQVTILFFDVDDFKDVNDNFGHPFGDYCLRVVSKCILESFSKTGLCYRIGGDEFCVISNQTNSLFIQQFQNDFLQRMSAIRQTEERLPTVSIGFAIYKDGHINDAVMKADIQMYDSKYHNKKDKKN